MFPLETLCKIKVLSDLEVFLLSELYFWQKDSHTSRDTRESELLIN